MTINPESGFQGDFKLKPEDVKQNILFQDRDTAQELYEVFRKMQTAFSKNDMSESDLALRGALFTIQQLKIGKNLDYVATISSLEEKLVALRNANLRKVGEQALEIWNQISKEFLEPYEFSEKLIQSRLEELIEMYAERVNEGGNAYIFKVDFDLVPKDLIKEIGIGSEVEGASAVKILKFFNHGTVKKELKKQRLFYSALHERVDDHKVSAVPKPYGSYTLRVAEQIDGYEQPSSHRMPVEVSAEHFNVLMTKKMPSSMEKVTAESGQVINRRIIEAELMIMDYVEGKDLATLMMEWILNNPPLGKDRRVIPKSFNELRASVIEILNLVPQEEAAGDEPGVQMFMQNEIYNHLKNTGFKVNSEIINQLVRTQQVLDAHNLKHPDAHSRNVMISGDVMGDGDVQTHLVDFGEVPDADTKELESIIILLKRLNGD